MNLLSPFDPWKSQLCTCPSKLSLNPYTGCSHGCLYCYASSYIPRFSEVRPKVGLHSRLARDLRVVTGDTFVSLASSSDPYPPQEERLGLTRGCLVQLSERDLLVQVVTKSDLVVRDADILSDMGATVAITITTLDEELAGRLEPHAPSPSRRLAAVRSLVRSSVPVSVRVDPIIPGLNDRGARDLISTLKGAGAAHVTSSTYKARPDSWRRLTYEFPEEMGRLCRLYFELGQKVGGSRYLPQPIRAGLLQPIAEACHQAGITFSSCREGLTVEGSCDGSHLARSSTAR
ncbi:MAG TPA: radical SAM protein [Methanotrichaceae archaeon]|nr:radical SAM protein [Methanotrichaceae archaeon]HQF17363.1 radical SAM protein [Methanotrichaceae archaeon]HQI91980.1 radical SAM protein [Methanotrichaceae archaeon]